MFHTVSQEKLLEFYSFYQVILKIEIISRRKKKEIIMIFNSTLKFITKQASRLMTLRHSKKLKAAIHSNRAFIISQNKKLVQLQSKEQTYLENYLRLRDDYAQSQIEILRLNQKCNLTQTSLDKIQKETLALIEQKDSLTTELQNKETNYQETLNKLNEFENQANRIQKTSQLQSQIEKLTLELKEKQGLIDLLDEKICQEGFENIKAQEACTNLQAEIQQLAQTVQLKEKTIQQMRAKHKALENDSLELKQTLDKNSEWLRKLCLQEDKLSAQVHEKILSLSNLKKRINQCHNLINAKTQKQQNNKINFEDINKNLKTMTHYLYQLEKQLGPNTLLSSEKSVTQ